MRRLGMIGGVVAVALAAGQFTQSDASNAAQAGVTAAQPDGLTIHSVVPSRTAPVVPPITPIPLTNIATVAAESQDLPTTPTPVADLQVADVTTAADLSDVCPVTLELFPEDAGMIGYNLTAPCQINARVVVRHAGLAFAAQTLATGSLFGSLPALDASGKVEVRFDDGATASAELPLPEVVQMRRIGVQWMKGDDFALNAFVDGAGYADAGHISAASNDPSLIVLGDATIENPMLAEVYTFGAKATDITIEAEVTKDTCGRELIGETLFSEKGTAKAMELTLQMPDCDAVGDFVVLNNPQSDMTIATAD